MARIPRYYIVDDHATVHVTWQCHNKDWFLEDDSMKILYYNLLLKYKKKYKIKIYSYSFMSSHPHLTLYCETKELLSDFFRIVNSMFAKTYNRINCRRGQVIIDRFKSPKIHTELDHQKVVIYGDFNQVRAGMVEHPKDWKWSSYHHYAYGKRDDLIDDASFYLEIGSTPEERQLQYCQLVDEILWEECIVKKNYSAVYFIGDPVWVEKKIDNLRRNFRKSTPQGDDVNMIASPPE